MSINDRALRVGEGQAFSEAAYRGQYDNVEEYINDPDSYNTGDILLVPTYRLEEVEEIVEPEKPGVPVEPYVGLTFKSCGIDRTIVGQTLSGDWVLAYFDGEIRANELVNGQFSTENLAWVGGYPRTPSTPAVTRKVKKWVKIEHSPPSEVPE